MALPLSAKISSSCCNHKISESTVYGMLCFDVLATITTLTIGIIAAAGKLRLPPAGTYSLFATSGVIVLTYISVTTFNRCLTPKKKMGSNGI